MARKGEMTDMKHMLDIMADGKVLRGKTISVTGHLGVPRQQFIDFVERHGGVFEKTPRYRCILVTNQDWTAKTATEGASLKLIKAQQNGATIMTEQEFYTMVGEMAASAAL